MASLFKKGLGGILADEMGLGKTIQAISFLLHLKHTENHPPPYLVVVPLSVLDNWMAEFQKFVAPDGISVFLYYGSKEKRANLQKEFSRKNKKDVLLTTFDTIYHDASFLASQKFSFIVVDEAHKLKNEQSTLHGILLSLNIQYSLLLTGTPLQNNIGELSALLAFACPSVFVYKTGKSCISTWFDQSSTFEELAMVKEVVAPFILRREKSLVLDLPDMKEYIMLPPLSSTQRKLYKSLLLKDPTVFSSSRTNSLMNVLMNLRKCCNHPYLFDGVEPEPFEAGEHLIQASGKLVVVDKLLAALKKRGHRVLIFSQMTHMLDILQDYLTYRGHTYERLDGSVRGEERFLAVQRFSEAESENESFVFLLSTRAGGVGLNLVAADVVIFFDSDFNPAMDMQAAARVHRIGQKNTVRVFRLLSEGSVDEIIWRRANAKKAIGSFIIQNDTSTKKLSKDVLFTQYKRFLTAT
ncbi:SNF2 family N-terminal domain-containing protein [Chytridium lagenaria]|nr:SNF2 family N-terminal domain-containing protein [Chytridium lagenaria]